MWESLQASTKVTAIVSNRMWCGVNLVTTLVQETQTVIGINSNKVSVL